MPRGGIFGAIALGLARAIGETMAVAMVLPYDVNFKWSMIGGGTTLTSMLASNFREPKSELATQSLTYLALILLVLTLTMNLLARLLVKSFAARSAKR